MRPIDLRFVRKSVCAAALAAIVGSQAVAAPSAQGYSLTLVDADVASVANEVLGETLRIPFSVDPAVTGKITLRVERKLTRDQLLSVFETALAENGVAMVRRADGSIALVPANKARGVRGVQSGRGRGSAGYQVVAEALRFATPSEVAKVLSATGADIVVHADDRLGLLVLGGTSEEIRAAEETIAVFDRNKLSDARMRVVTLRTASPVPVAADLDRLVKAADMSGVAVVPMVQLNAVVVLARSESLLDQMENWAARLDRPSTEEPTSLWIYRPNNIAADALAEALRALDSTSSRPLDPAASVTPSQARTSGGGGTEPGADPVRSLAPANEPTTGFTADALKVSVERSTNSLLVMAPASRWRSLKSALEQLDRAPDQVLIEATVLEVTLNRDFRFGVDWSYVNKTGSLNITQSQFPSGAIRPVYPGVSLTYINGGITAIVDALSARTDVEVVSSPKLVALNNQSATLQVGDQVPIVVQQAQGTAAAGAPLVVTTEYRDTGVILKIKPRINGEHSVLLDLSQEVSAVAPTTTSGIDSPTIQQRKFESSLAISEGVTVALGGLISSVRSNDDVGVPLLSRVPIAGSLFKTNTKSGRRTELIVLLNAKIIRAGQASDADVEALKRPMGEIRERGLNEAH